MPTADAIMIDSDEEPQEQPAKKLKQDRSPLVILSSETKKKQLTLTAMVSPRPPKQSDFKALSPSLPKSASKSPPANSTKSVATKEKSAPKTPKAGPKTPKAAPKTSKAAPKTPKAALKTPKAAPKTPNVAPKTPTQDPKTPESAPVAKTSAANKTNAEVTPSRGVKRKSANLTEEEGATPGKQKRLSDTDSKQKKLDELDVSSEVSEEKNATESDGSSKNDNPGTPKRKPTLESCLKRTPKTPSSESNGVSGSSSEKSEAIKADNVSGKKKFGDFKSKAKSATTPKSAKPVLTVPKKTSPVTIAPKLSGSAEIAPKLANPTVKIALKPAKPVKIAPKSATPVAMAPKPASQDSSVAMEDTPVVVVDLDSDSAEMVCDESEGDSSQTALPVKIHVDGEKPGPSGINSKVQNKKPRSLSVKQQKLQDERDKKKREVAEEKEKKRLERQKEKEARDEAKKEEQAKKDAEKVARDKLRDDVKKQKDEEKKQKDAERIEKDAIKKQKQAEKDEEEKLKEDKKEEDRLRKLKEQEKFKSFFVVKKPPAIPAPQKVEALEKKFREFVITSTMSVAPIRRTDTVSMDILSEGNVSWGNSDKHIKEVIVEMRSKDKLEEDTLSDDLEIISISNKKQVKVKRKILLFHENHRPPYCGSWRKKSTLIRARRPFAQDKSQLEYEYDSDDDWEEEEEGEDITSEKEDDKEEEKESKDEDDDEDDGFFVPHGYLSDDEGDEDLGLSEEGKKKRFERRKKQFDEEQKSKKSGLLKSKLAGPAWQNDPSSPSDAAHYLAQFAVVWSCGHEPVEPLDPFDRTQPVAPAESMDIKENKRQLPIEGYGKLIRFLHGSPIGMSRAVESFQEQWNSEASRDKVSKRQLTLLIPTLVKKYMRRGNGMRLCWYASDEILQKYDLADLLGLHSEAPEPAPAPVKAAPTNSLLKFTTSSSAEQQLAQLKHQQAQQQLLLQAQQHLLLQQQQQMRLQQQALQQQQMGPPAPKTDQNTLRSFLKNVQTLSGNGKSEQGPSGKPGIGLTPKPQPLQGSKPAAVKRLPLISLSSNANSTDKPAGKEKLAAPRRVTLVPVKTTSTTTPITIDDNSN